MVGGEGAGDDGTHAHSLHQRSRAPHPGHPCRAVAAADPPEAEARPPRAVASPPLERRRAKPALAGAAAEDEWIAPPWVFAVAVVVGSLLIVLVRYLRLG